MKILVLMIVSIFYCLPLPSFAADIEAGKQIFSRVCSYCHKSGYDDKFGPGLAGIMDRVDAEWLHKFLLDPEEMMKTDEYGKLLKENNSYNLTMPNLPDMRDEKKRADVIAYMGTLE